MALQSELTCVAVARFHAESGRLPRRQPAAGLDKASMEDNLAQRWHRVLRYRDEGEVAAGVLEKYLHLFEAEAKLGAEQAENLPRCTSVSR